MKLTIEISDSALRSAVEAEVGKAIAKVSEEVIQAKFDTILSTKLERIHKKIPNQFGVVLRSTIADYATDIMGETLMERRDYVRRAVTEILTQTLKNIK
jgi:hypothetical protein